MSAQAEYYQIKTICHHVSLCSILAPVHGTSPVLLYPRLKGLLFCPSLWSSCSWRRPGTSWLSCGGWRCSSPPGWADMREGYQPVRCSSGSCWTCPPHSATHMNFSQHNLEDKNWVLVLLTISNNRYREKRGQRRLENVSSFTMFVLGGLPLKSDQIIQGNFG